MPFTLGLIKLTTYPNIDQEMYPEFLDTVQELNMNDLISLLKDRLHFIKTGEIDP